MKTLPLCLLFLLAFAAPCAFSQGSLTPPAAPAPTMKTLDQVEPRTPINANTTPGDANSVFRITAAGSYYLTGNVTGVSGKRGISVVASNVTIDMKGFSLKGVGGSSDGIRMEAGSSNLTLRNGTITGWGEDGVDEVENSATDGIYENVHSTGNSFDGLRLNEKCVVTSCKVDHNGVHGLSVNGRATIRNCTANDNGANGFLFGAGSILDSVASSNGGSGIESTNEPVLIKNCVAFENSDAGIRSGGGGKISDCISRNNFGGPGIDAGSYTAVTNCTIKNNPTGISAGDSCHIISNLLEGNSTGINTNADKNIIDGNQVVQGAVGGTGILVNGGTKRNLIIRNTVGNYTPNYDIPADNRYGPIVNISAAGGAAVSGNSASSTLIDGSGGSHPWANFSY